ncbi:heme/hemin ABC transporter substrate-binding protein [Marinomonas sp. 2405UD68-3]|uniref:heme/hemin ABC transporter substrate-binding protein n=1 Tax=Marinomonas sp. 2405UD68-3 TaxID=3391835 RepID=UPI0039C900E9
MKWQTPLCITFISALCFASVLAFAFQASHAMSATLPIKSVDKVVSIGGATTEILFALGVGDHVIGSDTSSYYPEAAQHTKKVGYMRALSTEGVLSLSPDVVFSAEGAGPIKVLTQLKSVSLPWVTLPEVRSLDVLYENIEKIGRIMSVEKRAQHLIASLKQDEIQLAQSVSKDKRKPRVLFVMQHTGSPMVAGSNTSADRIIRLAGGENIAHEIQGYKPLTAEAMVNLNPEWIVSTSFGGRDVNSHDDSKNGLKSLPSLHLTDAKDESRLIIMDGLLLLGFGPRTIGAAQQLRSFWYDE